MYQAVQGKLVEFDGDCGPQWQLLSKAGTLEVVDADWIQTWLPRNVASLVLKQSVGQRVMFDGAWIERV